MFWGKCDPYDALWDMITNHIHQRLNAFQNRHYSWTSCWQQCSQSVISSLFIFQRYRATAIRAKMSHIKRENLVVMSKRHSQEAPNYNIYIQSRWIPRSTKKAVPEADRLPQATNCFLLSRNAEKKKIWQKLGWTTSTKVLLLKQKVARSATEDWELPTRSQSTRWWKPQVT